MGYIVSSLTSPVYEATADVIVIGYEEDISIESQYKTLEQEVGEKTYQQTMLTLAESNNIAKLVLADIGDLLPPEQRRVSVIKGCIDVEMIGNVISIVAMYSDPELVADIANSWAVNYQKHVNQIFGQHDEVLYKEVQIQRVELLKRYEKLQSQYELLILENPTGELEREIEIRYDVTLQLSEKQHSLQKLPLFATLDENRELYAEYRADVRRLERWLKDIDLLQKQIDRQSDSKGAENAISMASFLMQSKILLGTTGGINPDLEITMTDDLSTVATSQEDLTTFRKVIEERWIELEEEIDLLEKNLLDVQDELALGIDSDDVTNLINQMDQERLQLKVELERLNVEKRELAHDRDLAWDNYTATKRKLAELELNAQISDSKVRFASESIVPIHPSSPNKKLNTLISSVLGLMVSVFGVFALEYWHGIRDDETLRQN